MSGLFADTVSVVGMLMGIGQYVAAFVAVGGLARLSVIMATRAIS